MLSMKNMKVSAKLRLLVAISVVGLAVLGFVSYLTIDRVKVGSSLHDEMLKYSDLNADILAPALDVEQIRFATLKMLADGKEELPQDVALYQERKKAYVQANEEWDERLPDGKIKDLVHQAYLGGHQYMQLVEQGLIPALEQGNRQAADRARGRAVADLGNAVETTKQAIDLIAVQQKELAESGRKCVTLSESVLAAIGLLVGIVVAFLGATVGRGVSAGTASALAFANAI